MNIEERDATLGRESLTYQQEGVHAVIHYRSQADHVDLCISGVPINIYGNDSRPAQVSLNDHTQYTSLLVGGFNNQKPILPQIKKIEDIIHREYPDVFRTLKVITDYDSSRQVWSRLEKRGTRIFSNFQPLAEGEYLFAQDGELIPVSITSVMKGKRRYFVNTRSDSGKPFVLSQRCAFHYTGNKINL